MTVRRGTLYVGVFFLAAGAVTLGAATGALDRTATANALDALWPIAVIAIGVGLVLRRSPAALVAGDPRRGLPGVALGASFVAAPGLRVLCSDLHQRGHPRRDAAAARSAATPRSTCRSRAASSA